MTAAEQYKYKGAANMQTLKEIKASLIASLAQEYKQLRVDMRCCCITSTPFVIKIGGLFISPEFEGRKTTGKVKRDTCPLRATRFSRIDAENLAASVKNGAGENGRAVGIYQAVRSRHEQVREMLRQLTQ